MYDYETKIGILRIIEDDNFIIAVTKVDKVEYQNETVLIHKTIQELNEYFQGRRKSFSIPLKLNGTEFQKSVWNELLKIPYGQTKTYLDVAKALNNPNASRAIGNACNKNPLLILVPCHRVVGTNGSLVGFALGLDVKKELLKLEQ